MNGKKIKRSVTTELFFTYFLGYIAINVILLITVIGSIVAYEVVCSPRTYNSYFAELENKLTKDYRSITDEDLSDINGFIIKINSKNNITYLRGNVIEEFRTLNLQSYMYLFGVTKDNKSSLNDDLRTMFALSDFNNSIIETKDNTKYSLYTKYLKEEDSLVVVGFPYSEVTKPNIITKLVPHNIIVKIMSFLNIMLILSIVYILAKATSSAFINPIKTLLNGVIEISQGNYDVRLDIDKKNEFLELANGFNRMAETIQNEKRLKENLEKARESLILDISHDLKNPLASILGYSETLINNRDLDEEEKLEYLNIINKNSQRANKLITDLFEFSLYDNSDYKMVTVKTDMSEFIRQIIANYIPEFEHKKFEYDFDIAEEPYYVMINEEKLSRAINNILDNKVKYNTAGNKISIKTKVKNNCFCIILSDNGESIPEKYRETIFNPFVRVDKSRNSKTGGTGLGLSITKKILNKHNGSISIINSEEGTCFEITLPLVTFKAKM
ncbi:MULTISPECIES: HAMP domain-containing sensor histidine kinase [unclassified Clostridium]|uniref:sensor histidine kinase n=1 Tax=unclassified Clostridium TaxID=2614128 RepID=UPI00029829C2|nr:MULTISPECIES: HAMP domain-containing sensor histidine kinase [unclassified Clostridium]EKQ50915.1 MAG: signal transduction histidine kinase [Clostridium sp. Maddingley MBC34-26]